MGFEWDETKRKANLKKHGIDFEDVTPAFQSPMLIGLDTREEYGEDRWVGIGMVQTLIIVIAFTERSGNTIRIISARKALKNERSAYNKKAKKGFGKTG